MSDTEYKQFTDNIIDKLIDAERVTTLVLKDIATATTSSVSSASNAALLAVAAAERAEELWASMIRQQRPVASGNEV